MKALMAGLRSDGLSSLGGKKVVRIRDIGEGVAYDPKNPSNKERLDLPSSNVLQFFLEDGSVVSARPSGTEPKIKFYISCPVPTSEGLAKAREVAASTIQAIEREIGVILDKAKA